MWALAVLSIEKQTHLKQTEKKKSISCIYFNDLKQ